MRKKSRVSRHLVVPLVVFTLAILGILGWRSLSPMGARFMGYVASSGNVQTAEEAGQDADAQTGGTADAAVSEFDADDEETAISGGGQETVVPILPAAKGVCPLLLDGAVLESRQENAAGSSWILLSQATARGVGEETLCQLASAGWLLDHAGYLGLDDAAWGCVATSAGCDQVVMVYAVPQVFGAVRSEENLLRISVIALAGGGE